MTPEDVLSLARLDADAVLSRWHQVGDTRPNAVLAAAECVGGNACVGEYGCTCPTRCYVCQAQPDGSGSVWYWPASIDGLQARVVFDLCRTCTTFLQPVIGGDARV